MWGFHERPAGRDLLSAGRNIGSLFLNRVFIRLAGDFSVAGRLFALATDGSITTDRSGGCASRGLPCRMRRDTPVTDEMSTPITSAGPLERKGLPLRGFTRFRPDEVKPDQLQDTIDFL